MQPLGLFAGPAGLAAGIGLGELLVPIMLLDGDDRTMRFLEHSSHLSRLMRPNAWLRLHREPSRVIGREQGTSLPCRRWWWIHNRMETYDARDHNGVFARGGLGWRL